MARITVHIDQKTYHLECEEGQQNYIIKLTQRLGEYISNIRAEFGEMHHQQAAIMAALMAIDELTYARLKQKKLTKELEDLTAKDTANTAKAILEAAQKIKAIAESLTLEQTN
ncbi:cell division protein ZapA [Bartonella sp. TP]|uniref:cell division protein ZapA n=1 Tax=Bartonella sp. TP TaxID=3057550 RepID=UPI0025AEF97B|nr:cell division protein ZapA [Bartonella sp. TP]MDN5248492.1 cell division protein ZapA [Alphaproteobacteria bacterium]WJW79583.1 cell division protein ZapA [Bartonella sp. TP]